MRGPVLVRVLALVVLFGVAAPVPAGDLSDRQQQEILLEALRDYDRAIELRRADPEAARAAFRSSAGRLQLLVDDGVDNGGLHYNLANAHLQSGALGPAILSYRRAERLVPGDGRVEANLEYARSLCRSRVRPSGRRALIGALLFWHDDTSVTARFTVAAAAWVGFWIVLAVLPWLRSAAWRLAAGGLALVWVAAGASVAWDLWWSAARQAGVLLADDVTVRKGDGDGFQPQFQEPLHQGVEFELVERRDGWLHIRLPDDKTGWIRADQAALVG